MVNIMAGKYAGRLLTKLPLYKKKTFSRAMQQMAQDLDDQLITKLKGKYFV